MKNYSTRSHFAFIVLLILVPFFRGECQFGTHIVELNTGEKIASTFSNLVSPGAHVVYSVTLSVYLAPQKTMETSPFILYLIHLMSTLSGE